MGKNNIPIDQKEFVVTLSLGDINQILSALGNLPYVQVYQLIQDIRQQTERQLMAEYPENGQSNTLVHESNSKHSQTP